MHTPENHATISGAQLIAACRSTRSDGRSTRDRVLEYLANNPGAARSAIADALGLSYHTIDYHLARFTATGEVAPFAVGRGAQKHFFLAGSGLTRAARAEHVARHRAGAARVLAELRSAPGAAGAEHARRLGVSATTVAWHSRRFVELGLLPAAR